MQGRDEGPDSEKWVAQAFRDLWGWALGDRVTYWRFKARVRRSKDRAEHFAALLELERQFRPVILHGKEARDAIENRAINTPPRPTPGGMNE